MSESRKKREKEKRKAHWRGTRGGRIDDLELRDRMNFPGHGRLAGIFAGRRSDAIGDYRTGASGFPNQRRLTRRRSLVHFESPKARAALEVMDLFFFLSEGSCIVMEFKAQTLRERKVGTRKEEKGKKERERERKRKSKRQTWCKVMCRVE